MVITDNDNMNIILHEFSSEVYDQKMKVLRKKIPFEKLSNEKRKKKWWNALLKLKCGLIDYIKTK